MLATRPDVLPPNYIRELERIYHHVAPLSAEVSRTILAAELGSPVETVYRDFTDEPVLVRRAQTFAIACTCHGPDGASHIVGSPGDW